MNMDLHAKSEQLLTSLANSIHDREPNTSKPFFFTKEEMYVAQLWMDNFIKEVVKDCVCV